MTVADYMEWIHTTLDGQSFLLMSTDPYLVTESNDAVHAKLIYSTVPPYGECSLPVRIAGTQFFKATKRHVAGNLVHVEDSTIQRAAKEMGLAVGVGLHANLSSVPLQDVSQRVREVAFLERFSSSVAHRACEEVCTQYGVQLSEVHLTGGTQLHSGDVRDMHDLDVVIPVNSEEHLDVIWQRIERHQRDPVWEHGYPSPLRWRTSDELLICPFFRFGRLEPPIQSARVGERRKARLVVKSCKYSVFNAPILETDGELSFLLFRTRLLRAACRVGANILADVHEVEVLQGPWRGALGGVVTNDVEEIENLQELLSWW